MTPITVTYFSDVLCIWAYVAQARVDAVKRTFPGEARLDYRFVSVFGDTRLKLGEGWRDRGGFVGYARHVESIAQRFDHVTLNPRVWLEVQPASSLSPHLFLSAVLEWERTQIPAAAEHEPQIFESVTWALRRGFFADGLDISLRHVQRELAKPFGVDHEAIERTIDDGSAFARLSTDYQTADRMKIDGSPTFVLNDGRQKLFGNVGFRVIEANIREVLRDPNQDQASWC